MTVLADQSEQVEEARLDRISRRSRFLTILVVVLAVAVIGLTAWVVYDQVSGSDAAVNGDIEQLLDDYLRAWEARDEAAIRSATTEDFVLTEHIYEADTDGVSMDEEIVNDIDDVVSFGFLYEWQTEHVGTPIITGDGPWFLSVEENWVVPKGFGFTHADGRASYVVIDDGGTPKIANHYWTGLRYDTE